MKTKEELAEPLGVTQTSISKRLKTTGYTLEQVMKNWLDSFWRSSFGTEFTNCQKDKTKLQLQMGNSLNNTKVHVYFLNKLSNFQKEIQEKH